MRIGSFDQRITIRTKTVTGQDSYGQDIVTRTTYHTCWAQIDALKGREFEAAQQKWADARFKVRIRYKSSIALTMDIVWGSRTLDILDVQDLGRRHGDLILYCKEVT